jgi:hypothetical protein
LTIDNVTTASQTQPSAPQHTPPAHPRRRHYAVILGVSAIILTFAWWLSPTLGALLTIVTWVLLLARALGSDSIDSDRDRHVPDYRGSIWYL